MRRRVLLCLTLIFAMSACNGDRVGTPIGSATKPTNDISDATHSGDGLASNPDFFFLPPMVKQPGTDLPWNVGAFNPNLRPIVEICDFGPAVLTLPPGSICTGATSSHPTAVSITDEHYKVNWTVPTTATKFYRITVKVGNIRLGYADVESGASGASLKNVDTQNFVPLVDGRTLPIKFRIERYALCTVPGTGPCTSASADISTTPITVSTGTPTADPSGISTSAGVTIPAQGGATATPVTVTLATCADLSAALRRRTVGSCISVTTSPALTGLSNPATVFICEVGFGAYGLTPADEAAIRMYRSDAAGIAVLAPAPACKPGSPGGLLASATPSVRGMFASLLHGKFRHAADQALALVTPKPLYAAMFIDLGGGGFTDSFSDFQFAVPSVLIYGPTLFTSLGGARLNNEKTLAEAAGYDVTVWDAATWASKTSADFAKFSAIVIPDPMVGGDCSYSTAPLAAAEANRAVWSPSVNGPVVIIGTDPMFHQFNQVQAVPLMRNALKFAVSSPTKTGVYATLNCYYNNVTAPTAVTFLSGIGAFTVVGLSNLGETATILAGSHPVMAGLTSAGLSNWNDSAHEAFPVMSSYPASFEALAQMSHATAEGSLTYIIARP